MGLERAIASGKEHRKPYYGAKAVDYTCQNHGSCDYCRQNRMHTTAKRLEIAKSKLAEDGAIDFHRDLPRGRNFGLGNKYALSIECMEGLQGSKGKD